MGRILIAGSGKTALDIGFYFLEQNHKIHWVTNSQEQHTKVEKQIAKYQKRQRLFSATPDTPITANCSLLEFLDLPAVDVVIETSSEILIKKQQLFDSLEKFVTPETLLFSNSSSFLPHTISPRCLGAHFLFPLLLTNLIELIVPPGCSSEILNQSVRFFRDNNLDIIAQDSKNGFIVNRLLLPLQAECCKAIQQGIPLSTIDEASKCGVFPLGQLSLMDRVGLDIVHSAALQYACLIESADLSNHEIMLETLGRLVQLGKRGKKNKDGLLMGKSLPWVENPQAETSSAELSTRFFQKFQTRCIQALEREEITYEELTTVFTRVYQVNDFQLSDLDVVR